MSRSSLQIIQDKLGLGNTTDNATNVRLGIRVQRAKADIMDGSTTTVFTVAGGEVLITALYGIIQDGAHDATADTVKFQMDGTNGTTSDMCGTADLANVEQYALIAVPGVIATALAVASSGAVPVEMAPAQLVPPGSIQIVSGGDGGDGNSATLELNLWYIPLDDGATVVAA